MFGSRQARGELHWGSKSLAGSAPVNVAELPTPHRGGLQGAKAGSARVFGPHTLLPRYFEFLLRSFRSPIYLQSCLVFSYA